jgi:hypothetical protein
MILYHYPVATEVFFNLTHKSGSFPVKPLLVWFFGWTMPFFKMTHNLPITQTSPKGIPGSFLGKNHIQLFIFDYPYCP